MGLVKLRQKVFLCISKMFLCAVVLMLVPRTGSHQAYGGRHIGFIVCRYLKLDTMGGVSPVMTVLAAMPTTIIFFTQPTQEK